MNTLKKYLSVKRVIILVIIVALVFVGYRYFKKDGPEYIAEAVDYGQVIKEVSETGMIKVSEETNLGFKSSGKIETVYIKVGDKVLAGQALVELDTDQLRIELSEARANLRVVEADYDELLAGSSEEEIQIAKIDVLNAETDLSNKKQSLENIKIESEEDLVQSYENAYDELSDAQLDIANALSQVGIIESKYFGGVDSQGSTVRNAKIAITNALESMNDYLNNTNAGERGEIDLVLSETKNLLSNVRNALIDVKGAMESPSYSDDISSTDKTAIDNHRSYINTAYSEILASQQAIATARINIRTNLDDAQALVTSAEVALERAIDHLALVQADPVQETKELYLAKVNQAQTKVSLIQTKINEAVLTSPVEGQIIRVNKRKGETVQLSESVVTILPEGPFQVEVDIYEEDIVDVDPGDSVIVELPAFPDKKLEGRVLSVDPAEKLIDGIVYYEVNISVEVNDLNVKPGMTADVVIETNKKENVLRVPIEAIEREDGKRKIKVLENNQLVYKEVEFGLEGEDYVEIISGVSQGEQVIIGENNE